jgi:hypothetical protein
VHRPVARFRDKPALQRDLLALAEEHNLSKATFEIVIELRMAKKPYKHLLVQSIPPVERARIKAQKDRERILKRAERGGSESWIDYAREQVEAWRELLETLENTRSGEPRADARSATPQGVM